MTGLVLAVLCPILILTIVPHILWHFKHYKGVMFFRLLAYILCLLWACATRPCLDWVSLPEWVVPVVAISTIYNYFAVILEMVFGSLKEAAK